MYSPCDFCAIQYSCNIQKDKSGSGCDSFCEKVSDTNCCEESESNEK